MVIYLPGQSGDEEPLLDELTPREIVRELDKHVVGQADAKRAVAVALRNRIRRQKLAPEMAEEVMPKNILMVAPTGGGKTEIARRLARLANSPFLKVEASKFTEVGYVGRDVESMVRDLVEASIALVREEETAKVRTRARRAPEDPRGRLPPPRPPAATATGRDGVHPAASAARPHRRLRPGEAPGPAPRRHPRRPDGGAGRGSRRAHLPPALSRGGGWRRPAPPPPPSPAPGRACPAPAAAACRSPRRWSSWPRRRRA